MKRFKIIVIFCFLNIWISPSQYIVKNISELKILKELPQEKVFIDHTGPIIFTGEYLYYSFDCFNAQTHTYTTLSKLGYVVLVNENKEYVLEQKIRLNNGRGQGDFFVPTEIPSGNYKLLGYTNWMKNNGLKQVFKDDLVIINPYQAEQLSLLPATETRYNKIIPRPEKTSNNSASPLGLIVEKANYGKREKLKLILNNFKGNLGHGIYSIKVRKKSDLYEETGYKAIKFAENYLNVQKNISQTIGDSIFLPEQKGELIMGTLIDRSNGQNIPDTKLIISLPGDEFLLKTISTNEDGQFYAYLDEEYKVPRAVIQVENGDREYDINLKSAGRIDLSNLTMSSYKLDKDNTDEIKQRSIYNQISNQFFSITPDSVMVGKVRNPFDFTAPEVKDLDEFTRFQTLEETIIELYHNVSYRENGNKPDFIRMEMNEGIFDGYYEAKPSLVMIDGVFIPNHEEIKDFNAQTIRSISLVRDIYRIGGKEYYGLMQINTFDGDFYESYSSKYGTNINLNAPKPVKNYYKQSYEANSEIYKRIPDYRYLLFWKPHIEVKDYEQAFEFFTSDVAGEFEIILNGFTFYGKPISITKSFRVE